MVVREFVLVDPDVVEEWNFSRLFGAYQHHVGRPKVEMLREHVHRANPAAAAMAVQRPVEDATGVLRDAGVDVVVAGLDQVSARMWLNEWSVRHLVPYVDAGVEITTAGEDGRLDGMTGYVQTVVPGVTECFHCIGRDDPDRAQLERMSPEERQAQVDCGYVDADVLTPEAAVVYLNGVAASLAVDAATRLVTGMARPPGFLRFDGLPHELTRMSAHVSDGCRVCAELLARGPVDAVDDNPAADMQVPEVN